MKKIIISSLISTIAMVGFATTTFAANTSSVQFNTSLGYGIQNNQNVTLLQQFLINEGFLNISAPTGNFFSMTKTAVKDFQKAHGISTTGYFGPLTMAAANSAIVSSNTPSTPPATVAIQSVTKQNTSLTATVLSFLTSAPIGNTITWSTNNYPANTGVNINLIKKVSDSPISYTIVRQLATNAPNTGTFSWTPTSDETGANLYAEVTCANNTSPTSACQISADPIQVQ